MICIYLPRHAAPEEKEAEAANAPAAPARSSGNETILLVDDEPLIRMLAAEQLEDLGYHVVEAEDAAAAIRLFDATGHIDLLISDVGLPGGMNGRQLADTLRGKQPGLEVLFITGYAENAVLNHGHLAAGMHVITKPFQMDNFSRRVKQLLSPEA